MPPRQPDHLYGLHDPGGEHVMRGGRNRRGDVNAQSGFQVIAQFNRDTATRAFITNQE